MRDLHELPKIRDSWSHLYVEHCRIDQDAKAVVIEDARGQVPVPCANLSLLLLGPGTTLTHAAVRALADNGCLVVWCGEQGIRFYAQGLGETRSAAGIMRQAKLWCDPKQHLEVVLRLYQLRFSEPLGHGYTLQQIRGMEGARVRKTYQEASQRYGVEWTRRDYNRRSWGSADALNRALSVANSCLYGICHAAIVAAGYSPALGFIHVGKLLSFVYDIADLYKTETTIPTAFSVAARGSVDLEGRVRRQCRDSFRESRLLERIVPDLHFVLAAQAQSAETDSPYDTDLAAPGGLWDPAGELTGGANHAEEGVNVHDGTDSGEGAGQLARRAQPVDA